MDKTTKHAHSATDANLHARPNHDSSSSSLRGDASSQPSHHTTHTSRSTPYASRESSPTRPTLRPGLHRAASNGGARLRKSSQQDISPSRTVKSNLPTPTSATHRLSSTTTPVLQPVSTDTGSRSPVPHKSPTNTDHPKDSPRWPISPRLRSPPPMLGRPNTSAPRKTDQDPPSIHVQRSTPSPAGQPDSSQSDQNIDENQLQPGMRTPGRGASGSTTTLETVQEVSPLASPHHAEETLEKVGDSAVSEIGSQADHGEGFPVNKVKSRANLANNESGSDSGSIHGDISKKPATTSVPPALISRHSSVSTRHNAKAKPAEGSVQNMTVETETVTSIPQVSVAPVVGKEVNGSLRTKPSSETIRPKKEKKKTTRKQPTVSTGNATSKADIFEAKIASAVDEADSSDSEETFVYDSNPPDGGDRPRRFHSRTPSATSMASQVDRSGMRSINSIMENPGPSAAFKKNMKFVNTFNSSGNDSGLADDDGKGTARSNASSARGTGRVHHHFGRWGRNGNGNGHPSLFDNDAPFHLSSSAAQRAKFPPNPSRQSSGPPSPRVNNSGRLSATGKRGIHMTNYDLDDTTGADDERTPLIQGSVRSNRSGRGRRNYPASLRALEGQSLRGSPSVLNRFASCLVLTIMLLLVVSGAIGFMFATSQPLSEIELKSIKNVLASEQELMFDLTVKAHNPNVVVVVIDSANMEVFAKSPHAGTDSEWWRHPPDSGSFAARRSPDHVSDGNTMDNSTDDDHSPNMRLGTILQFDSPLSFEGSFFNQGVSSSTGEVRLQRPGNGTDGGSERWERILEDEFDLIVKGVLKYSLPLSQRVRSVAISGRTTVKPNSANDPTLHPNKTEVTISRLKRQR